MSETDEHARRFGELRSMMARQQDEVISFGRKTALRTLLEEAHSADPTRYEEQWAPYLERALQPHRVRVLYAPSPWKTADTPPALDAADAAARLVPFASVSLHIQGKPEAIVPLLAHPVLEQVEEIDAHPHTLMLRLDGIIPIQRSLRLASEHQSQTATPAADLVRTIQHVKSSPTFRQLDALHITGPREEPSSDAEDWRLHLATLPQLPNLRTFKLQCSATSRRAALGDGGRLLRALRLILGRLSATHLRTFSLHGAKFGDACAALLADAPALEHVHTLALEQSDLTIQGLRTLTNAATLQRVRSLNVLGSRLGPRALHALLYEVEGWPALEELRLVTQPDPALLARVLDRVRNSPPQSTPFSVRWSASGESVSNTFALPDEQPRTPLVETAHTRRIQDALSRGRERGQYRRRQAASMPMPDFKP